jgi:hypothetical protein
MTRNRRIAAICLAVILIYSTAWYIAAGMIETRVMTMLAAQQPHGVTIVAAKYRKSGYPLAFHVTLKTVSLSTADGLSVTAPRVRLGIGITGPSHISFVADRGVVASLSATGSRAPADAAITRVSGSVQFVGRSISDATIEITGATLSSGTSTDRTITVEMVTANVSTPDAPPQGANQPGCHVTVSAAGVAVPPPGIPSLGNTMQSVSIDAMVMGQPPALNAAAVAGWRDGGGAVEIDDLSATWGPLALKLNGTLALDSAFQPQFSGRAVITGFDETLDAMASTGAMKARNLGLVKMGLGVIAKPDADGTPTLNVPLTIQDQALYVSHFKIAAVPKIDLF